MTRSVFQFCVATFGLAFAAIFCVVVVPPLLTSGDIFGAALAGFVNPLRRGHDPLLGRARRMDPVRKTSARDSSRLGGVARRTGSGRRDGFRAVPVATAAARIDRARAVTIRADLLTLFRRSFLFRHRTRRFFRDFFSRRFRGFTRDFFRRFFRDFRNFRRG